MSVSELQALTQKFADAFDQRDLKTVLEMLSEDVEVFDHVPYWFDGKPLFAKYLNEAYEGIVWASFGFRQPSCRTYGDTVGIVNAYDMFTGVGLCSAIEKILKLFAIRENSLLKENPNVRIYRLYTN